jgi:hypothetical protein
MRSFAFLMFAVIIAMAGCNGKEKSGKKISKILNDKIVLENGNTIPLFAGEKGDKTVQFIIRNGQSTKPDSTRMDDLGAAFSTLTDTGQLQAQAIANLFADLNFESVLSPMSNFATEYGQPLADRKAKLVYNYNANDYGSLLDYIYNLKYGHKFVIIAYQHKIPDLINLLSLNKQIPPVADDDYNDVFVLFTKKRGDAEVIQLEY